VKLALEVIERLPRLYKVEAEYAISLAAIHAALAGARPSTHGSMSGTEGGG